MSVPMVPVQYALNLLEQAQKSGCKVEELLKELELDQDYFDNRSEVPALKYGEIYQVVMRSTQDEWFGIFADGKVPLGAFRLMCLTLLHCSDLSQAIIRAGEFADICRGLQVRYTLSLADGKAKLTLSPSRSMSQEEFNQKVSQAAPETLLASLLTWHRLSEWMIGIEIPVQTMTVSFSQSVENMPHNLSRLPQITYGSEANSISYDAKFLAYPVVQNQDSLMSFLRTAPYHLVTEDHQHVRTADKVRNILKRDVSGNMPSAEAVASQLNMSVTTLRRQLQKDDTSYQRLKDECRMEAAFHYLSCQELSNTDIAEKLGFDEPSAFFRSFKKWTGQTPGEYRANLV
ncbi:putative HTH-type transcriptional regulator [Thalassocella blandensis]|nr:putative HTH-type transcriptional regulator [Thalassocella blandensis]